MEIRVTCYRDAVSYRIRVEFKENIVVFVLLILRKHRHIAYRYLRSLK